jgi:hypothetical protein
MTRELLPRRTLVPSSILGIKPGPEELAPATEANAVAKAPPDA